MMKLGLVTNGGLAASHMDRWRHKTDKPQWDGSPLNGKRILLYGEQGLGDTLQASRYATMVAERGGHVILEVQDGLRQLAQSIEGVKEVIIRGEPVPPFDAHAAVMSLPEVFSKLHAANHSSKGAAYITSDRTAKVEKWREILGDAGGKLKVGIAWEGGAFLRENFLRSATLAEFAQLAAVPNVRSAYSLQKGPASRQILNPPAGMDIVDLDSKIVDFSDTAAIIANLDLLIAVDTAVVHVAGAMARPVWNLVARNLSGHMWMTNRPDTPSSTPPYGCSANPNSATGRR